jgi:hypothetical protein
MQAISGTAQYSAVHLFHEARPASASPAPQAIVVKQTSTIQAVSKAPSDWENVMLFVYIIVPLTLGMAFSLFVRNMRTKDTRPVRIGSLPKEDLPGLDFPLSHANPVAIADWLEKEKHESTKVSIFNS